MSEIPSDVMKAAYDAALDYRHGKACDPIHNDDSLQVAFARAILAERERCIEILEGLDSYDYVHEAIFLIGGE